MLPCFFCRFDEAVLALQGRQPAIDIIIEIGRLQIAQLLPLLGSDDHGSSSHSPAIPSPFRPQGIIIRESNNQIILHISLRMDFETSPTLPALRKSFCFFTNGANFHKPLQLSQDSNTTSLIVPCRFDGISHNGIVG